MGERDLVRYELMRVSDRYLLLRQTPELDMVEIVEVGIYVTGFIKEYKQRCQIIRGGRIIVILSDINLNNDLTIQSHFDNTDTSHYHKVTS